MKLTFLGTRGNIEPHTRRHRRHASIAEQIRWCAAEGVPRMILTHCGSQIVGGDERGLAREIGAMGEQHGVEVGIAADGQELVLR